MLCLNVSTFYALLSLIMQERRLYFCAAVPHVALCPPVVQSCF